MHLLVVFAKIYIEVCHPAELAVDVALLGKFSVVRHACPLQLVLFVRVQMSLRLHKHVVLVFEVFVEVLLHTSQTQLQI